MLDVEFLLNQPVVDRPIIYIYTHGSVRKAVRLAIETMLDEWPTFDRCKPSELGAYLKGRTLFPLDAVFCDWRTTPGGNVPFEEIQSLQALATHKEGNCAVFVHQQDPIRNVPQWSGAEQSAFVIEEPSVTKENLPIILRYMQHETALGIPEELLAQQTFLDGFSDLIETKRSSIFEARYRFIELALTQTETADGSVLTPGGDPARLRRADEAAFRALRKLTLSSDHDSARAFVAALEERALIGDWSSPLMSRTYGWTARLLGALQMTAWTKESYSASDPELDGVLVWAALLCAWEARLFESTTKDSGGRRRDPNMQIVEFERLTRAYLDRMVVRDPLVGHWAHLRTCIDAAKRGEMNPQARARFRVLQALHSTLAGCALDRATTWKIRLTSLLEKLPEDCEQSADIDA